jgi:hypothetical protein
MKHARPGLNRLQTLCKVNQDFALDTLPAIADAFSTRNIYPGAATPAAR